MRVLTIVGAWSQFIKAAPVSKALLSAGHTEYLIHTGQHYDRAMSQVFFDELSIPQPDINLAVGSGKHGRQVGKSLSVTLCLRPHLLYHDPAIRNHSRRMSCK